MGAAIQGLRGSGEFTADYRPKNYRELYTLLEPNGTAPLNALLSMAQSEATDDPEYKNFRDEMPNRVVTINNGGGYNSSATSLTIAAANDNKYAIAGAILVNSRTGEVVRVTADTTSTTLAVVRNIGSTAYTINQSDTFFVSGYAATENDTTPTTVSFDADVVSNYTQIFRTAFGLSNTLKSTYLRTGPKEDELTTKALKLHMSDIERAMFFGIKAEENGSSSTPRRYTGGLMTSISTTINLASAVDSDGTMSETQFDDQLIQTVFKYGSKEKLVFGGWKAAALLQQIGKARWQPQQVGGTYGVNITRYSTFAGDLMFHLHPAFRQVPGMDGTMIFLDVPNLKYRYLQGRDTNLYENRQGNNQDGVIHEYMTECGLELLQDKVHTVIKGWTGL